MNTNASNPAVAMQRTHLDGLPAPSFPSGFRLRAFASGDEARWLALQQASDTLSVFTPETFQLKFGTDAAAHAARIRFLETDAGEPVATAAAWFDDLYRRPDFGRVHWVAVHPAYQGRGLSTPLMLAILALLRERGHRAAYLTTGTARIAAINLYLKLSFTPWLRDAQERRYWEAIRPALKYPLAL